MNTQLASSRLQRLFVMATWDNATAKLYIYIYSMCPKRFCQGEGRAVNCVELIVSRPLWYCGTRELVTGTVTRSLELVILQLRSSTPSQDNMEGCLSLVRTQQNSNGESCGTKELFLGCMRDIRSFLWMGVKQINMHLSFAVYHALSQHHKL